MKTVLFPVLITCLLVACGGTLTVTPQTPATEEVVATAAATVARATPTPGEVAEQVLQKVADSICPGGSGGPYPSREFFSHDTAYGFRCDPSPGHSTTTVMQWFSDERCPGRF